MKKKLSSKKEVLIALVLVAVTIGSGFLVQVLLQFRAMHAAQQQATAIVSTALEEIHAACQDVRDTQDAAAQQPQDTQGAAAQQEPETHR